MNQNLIQAPTELSTMKSNGRVWYQAAVGAAIVAGAFSLVVSVVMLVNHSSKQSMNLGVLKEKPGPLDSTELIALKKQLLDTPQDEDLKQKAQSLDQQLREDYFRRSSIAYRGRYLLLVGLVVFFIGLKSAISLQTTRPLPPGVTPAADSEVKYIRIARRAIGILGLFIVGSALALFTLQGESILQSFEPAKDKEVPPEVANKLGEEMMEALVANDPEKARELLRKGANPNTSINGVNLLEAACLHGGHYDIVETLVKKGVDVKAEFKDGMTALWLAAESGNMKIIKFLIEHGAEIDAGNGRAGTPFLLAAANGHWEVAEFLLEKGADVNGRNSAGATALDCAARAGKVEMVKTLLNSGADATIEVRVNNMRMVPLIRVQVRLALVREAEIAPPMMLERNPTLRKVRDENLNANDLEEIIRLLQEAETNNTPIPHPASEQVQIPGSTDITAGYFPTLQEIQKNWPRFRGPGGSGISAYTNIPTQWDGPSDKGILWKTKEDLKPGHNSPIVWEDQVFLTGADICEDPNLVIYSFNSNSGELLWQQSYKHPHQEGEEYEIYEDTGCAASTMATDGKRVYAIFITGDVYALDFKGTKVWEKHFGIPDSGYGYATSLAMYRNLLLIQFDQGEDDDDKSVLYALNGKSGKVVWQKVRPVAGSWTSPIVIHTDKNEQIITCSDPLVISYDAATGKELWRADIMGSDVAPSPIYANGLIFVIQPYDSVFAIRPDGKGDVSKTHIAWAGEDGIPDIASPVSNGDLIFLLDTGGYITCYETKTGKKIWEDDLGEEFQSSPSVVGDHLYLLSLKGVMHIIKADREFVKVGKSTLGESSTCSPAFMDGRIYIRGEKHLYCIAAK